MSATLQILHSTVFSNCSYTASLKPPKSIISRQFTVRAVRNQKTELKTPTPSSSPEEITQKYGLEAGLWKDEDKKDDNGVEEEKTSKGDQAKQLLAKYGGAYLATSISLSIVSFSLCYALVNAGVDIQSLLQKVGISTDATGEKVGTFALAYAAHKAASPIRFPPTVALTPIVAGWIGKKKADQQQK
ncbi:Protein FAM210B, mitochondrial [Linum perenne]